jgi:hypothetical protein
MHNECTLGNGAVALWFHIPRLRRAVPECERYAGEDHSSEGMSNEQ